MNFCFSNITSLQSVGYAVGIVSKLAPANSFNCNLLELAGGHVPWPATNTPGHAEAWRLW